MISINRVKLNKHNAENFIKIGCKIRKLWHFKVSPISTKQLYAQHGGYANEIADDVTHSLFLLYFIIWIIEYFNFCRFDNKEAFPWITICYNNGNSTSSVRNQFLFYIIMRKKLKYFTFHIIKYKRNSEWMTSSVPSFAYWPRCAYNCFVKLSEILKFRNFLILHPILMKFSALCLFDFSLFIEINLILVWTWPLINLDLFQITYTSIRYFFLCSSSGKISRNRSLPI